MAEHVYHWKHGWIPLDHAAAVKKSHGNSAAATAMLRDARSSPGIRSRRDVAHAVRDLPNVPSADRVRPKHEIIAAAEKHGAQDLLPSSWHRSTRTGLSADLVRDLRGGSADKHLVTDHTGTRFSPERAALHDKIVGEILGNHKSQEQPAFVMLGGGPASGKTKAAQAAAHDFPDAVKIDPDEIKKMLPEYKQMNAEQAAGFVHEESSYLAKRATEAALQRKTHIVLDAVGDNSVESVRGKISKARAAGYSTHGRYVTVPTEVAQERAHARGVKSGRVVHPEVVAKLHSGVSNVFPQVMHDFDTAALYDNTAEWKQVLTKYRGQPEMIHELELYRAFVQKGKRG